MGVITITRSVPQFVHHKVLIERLTEKPRSPWGKIFRDVRIEQGLSQRQLSELAQVHRNVLRRLERNGGTASIEVIERVAAVLGYELDLMQQQKSVTKPG